MANWNCLAGWGSLLLNVLILVMISYGYVKIMKNDLLHLSLDVRDIKDNVSHLFEKVNKVCQRISFIEGRLKSKK